MFKKDVQCYLEMLRMKKSQKVATGGVSASDIDVGLSYCGIWSA